MAVKLLHVKRDGGVCFAVQPAGAEILFLAAAEVHMGSQVPHSPVALPVHVFHKSAAGAEICSCGALREEETRNDVPAQGVATSMLAAGAGGLRFVQYRVALPPLLDRSIWRLPSHIGTERQAWQMVELGKNGRHTIPQVRQHGHLLPLC